jgi:hypothetical protein
LPPEQKVVGSNPTGRTKYPLRNEAGSREFKNELKFRCSSKAGFSSRLPLPYEQISSPPLPFSASLAAIDFDPGDC